MKPAIFSARACTSGTQVSGDGILANLCAWLIHCFDCLHNQHAGNSNEAIKQFYSIRYDSQLGLKATYHIIEICINPDNQTFGGEVFDSISSNNARYAWCCHGANRANVSAKTEIYNILFAI